jgi:hypothetical protein
VRKNLEDEINILMEYKRGKNGRGTKIRIQKSEYSEDPDSGDPARIYFGQSSKIPKPT